MIIQRTVYSLLMTKLCARHRQRSIDLIDTYPAGTTNRSQRKGKVTTVYVYINISINSAFYINQILF